MKKIYYLENLDCANCAAKIETNIRRIPKVKNADIDFMQRKLVLETAENDMEAVLPKVHASIRALEPEVELKEKRPAGARHSRDHEHSLEHAKEKKELFPRFLPKLMPEEKASIMKIMVALALYIVGWLIQDNVYLSAPIFVASYLLTGGEVLLGALKNLLHGKVFDENFLMSIATLGAFAIGERPEAAAVMLFYAVGEWFQDYAVNRSRRSISELMDIRPDYANLKRGLKVERVAPETIHTGDVIIVKPGEKVPLDGKVLEGYSSLDTSALTGESAPRDIVIGDEVLSGCINGSGTVTLEVTKPFSQSTVSKILDLVENASSKKAPAEKFITKFARYYTPIVVGISLLLGVIPPLFLGGAWDTWIYRALLFLLISCPCALVISIPLSFFGGIGGASKAGILIKGSNYMEILANTRTVVFDKTGTLTKGNFAVAEICPAPGVSKEALLELAALAEKDSTHPISLSLKNAWGKELQENRASGFRDIPGQGVMVELDGEAVYAGNEKLMKTNGLPYAEEVPSGTVVHVAKGGAYQGYILIADEIKPDAKHCLDVLKEAGVKKTVMLTGDNRTVAEAVGRELGMDEVYAQLLPGDKVDRMETLLSSSSQKGNLAFVGDGINDAPVLARADIGVAMGGLGSDAAIEAADVVIMTDEPSKLALAMKIAKKTLSIVKQNIAFALGVKLIILALGAFGMTNMWVAMIADVGVAMLAILNASRASRVHISPKTEPGSALSSQSE